MDFKAKKESLAEIDEAILLADGFEDALVGYCTVFSKTIAIYDEEKCIEILMKRDGMSNEDAREHFSFNVTGSYVGENTPGFATFFEKPERKSRRRPKRRKCVSCRKRKR